MSTDEKLNILLSLGGECINVDELKSLLESGRKITAYDGFEPSGKLHIAQGIQKVININKMTKCGIKFVLLVADRFAMLNQKMGRDLERIRDVGRYMIEVWKAAGLNMDNVDVVWSSDLIREKGDEYWSLVMDIAESTTLTRINRCINIMGRSDPSSLMCSQVLYPVMQCADIRVLDVDICQLGHDQRKVNMLAREYYKSRGCKVPIILSHPMLRGLLKETEKMSKSIPGSAIYMDDSEAEVHAKIKKAYCPEATADPNPVMEYYRYIIFEKYNSVPIHTRDRQITYCNYATFETDYLNGILHPADIKPALSSLINELLFPIREHFRINTSAKALLEKIGTYTITR